jgi:hypothetical protein
MVPISIDDMGSKIITFISMISIVTTIIYIAPPTITCRVRVNVANLTCSVDVGGGLAITAAATIIADRPPSSLHRGRSFS